MVFKIEFNIRLLSHNVILYIVKNVSIFLYHKTVKQLSINLKSFYHENTLLLTYIIYFIECERMVITIYLNEYINLTKSYT